MQVLKQLPDLNGKGPMRALPGCGWPITEKRSDA